MKRTCATQVYIVEDSPSIRTRLTALLVSIDQVSVVGTAANAPDAVAGILGCRPDSVLLDLNLNGTSGMQVLRTVRRRAPEIVFVILSNHSEPQYRRACQLAGADYFLDKSTEFERVREVFAQIASSRH